MLIPYCTIENDIEVAHTPLNNKGEVLVRIEIPDEKLGFRVFECTVPSLNIKTAYGISPKEKVEYLDFCYHNTKDIIEYAKVGGIKNA